MYKGFKLILVFVLLSFFSQKMEATIIINLNSVENTPNEKQTSIVTNESGFQSFGITNEIHYQFPNSNLIIDSSIANKKLLVKFLCNSLSKKEQHFTDKVQLLLTFCNKNEVSFSAVQIIFPFHYFW
jgi:translation initiation factor 2 beta subunit (eIF-2beta)/eIF-5